MKKNWIIILGALVIACALFGRTLLASSVVAAAIDQEFEGKILVVTSQSDSKVGVALEKAEVKRIGESAFLVGTGVDDGQKGNWYKGLRIWLPISAVSRIVEFPSMDAFRKIASPQG